MSKKPLDTFLDNNSSTSWRSSFFEQVFEPRPQKGRVHEWVHFNIKNLGEDSDLDNDPLWQNFEESEKSSKKVLHQNENVRKSNSSDPFWVKNDGECDAKERSNKVIEFWPLNDEVSPKNQKQVCARTLSKISYESTGPNDERFYGELLLIKLIGVNKGRRVTFEIL